MKSDHPSINDSVSGLAVGDPVKLRGIDVGTVKSMIIDPDNSRLVVVGVRVRKETPCKAKNAQPLRNRGWCRRRRFYQLNGGDPAAKTLLAVTPQGKIPEIPSRDNRPQGHARRAAEGGQETVQPSRIAQESCDERRWGKGQSHPSFPPAQASQEGGRELKEVTAGRVCLNSAPPILPPTQSPRTEAGTHCIYAATLNFLKDPALDTHALRRNLVARSNGFHPVIDPAQAQREHHQPSTATRWRRLRGDP